MAHEAKLKIKSVLKKYEVSQYELAKRLDVPTNHITNMIKSDYNPTFKTLKKLAKAVGCKISEFIEE